jgi:hypothetical protein
MLFNPYDYIIKWASKPAISQVETEARKLFNDCPSSHTQLRVKPEVKT